MKYLIAILILIININVAYSVTIPGCQDINSQGKYDLNSDILSSNTCFNILADNVELDCNNHKITGTQNGFGIYLNNRVNIQILNCNIENFTTGINATHLQYSVIENVSSI